MVLPKSDYVIVRCRTNLLFVVVLLAGVRWLQAEQLRIAIAQPEIRAQTMEGGQQATNSAALWQSLVTGELSKQEFFAVVERDELPALAGEWALVAGRGETGATNGLAVHPDWLGADCLVISQWQTKDGTNELAIKILNVEKGASEKELVQSFAGEAMEASVRVLATDLRAVGLRLLAQRRIHTLAAVHDFDLESALDWNRWRERAIARRLRVFLQRQPGVLVLEREDVEALLQEMRLRRGGLAAPEDTVTNRWPALRHYLLVTGTIAETQPEGQPLTLRITTRLRALESGDTSEFAETFAAEKWYEGIGRVETGLRKSLPSDAQIQAPTLGQGGTNSVLEAFALYARALKLTGVWEFSTPETFRQSCPEGMLDDSALWIAFGTSRIPMYGTPARRANILRAAQYLKAALVADDHDPRLKLLLASILVDRDVKENDLAIQLFEEVGWQFPEHRLSAWAQVYYRTTGEMQRRYLRLLIEQYPESRFARVPAEAEYAKFLEKHRADPDLTIGVDAIRPHMDREANQTRGTSLEGCVRALFDYTQVITGSNPESQRKGYELQTPENRARGVALLEEMIQKHPDKAFFLCHFWSYYWNYRTDDEEDTCYWYKRAADAVPAGSGDKWGMSAWWDQPRIALVRRWMDHGKFKEALPYLEKITNGHLEGERDFRLARCAFEVGDYERALKLFRAFGRDHKEGTEWAAKCEQKLGLPPLQLPPKVYAAITNTARWAVNDILLSRARGYLLKTLGGLLDGYATGPLGQGIEVRLPPDAVWSMAVDDQFVWLGLVYPDACEDFNLLSLERNAELRANALRQGGLLRWSRATGETKVFSTADGLPHPWVSALASSPRGLWVGTLGGGIGLLDRQTGQWTVWTETNGLPLNWVRSLAWQDDTLWAGFGYLERGAVAKYSAKNGQWRTMLRRDFPAQTNYPPAHIMTARDIPGFLKEPRVVSYVPVSTVGSLQAIEERLWCALPGERRGSANERFEPRGTVICDLRTNGWYHVSGSAASGFARVGQRVWLSLGKAGLASCDLKGGDWQTITPADGLPMAAGTIRECHGRLLIVADGLMVMDSEHKRFEIYPFPTPGGAGLMAVAGDRVYVVRGNQILWLDLSALPLSNPAAPSPPR